MRAPIQVWVGDIIEIKIQQGKFYLPVHIDLYSRRLVGIATAVHMHLELSELTLQRVLSSRKPSKGIDQSGSFNSDSYQKLLKTWGLKQIVSQRGNCRDNAIIESLFKDSILKRFISTLT